MVLINPEVTDEALTAAVDEVGGYITSPGAEITYTKRDTPWGRRRLAYPIERFRDATYVLYQFLASPSALTEMERELKLDDRVIRYLLVRQDNLHVQDEEEAGEETEASASDDESDQDEVEDENVDETDDVDESNDNGDDDDEDDEEEDESDETE
jgi:small subunit ribosomal protein S6